MFSLKINEAKGMFFDRAKVMGAVNSATLKSLRQIGGYVRRVARNSIKPKPYGISAAAGRPPFTHTGGHATTSKRGKAGYRLDKGVKGPAAGLRNILFVFDPVTQSVRIGPTGTGRSIGSKTVPELVELGGRVSATRPIFRGRAKNGKYVIPKKSATFSAHPFMQPAQDAGAKKFPKLFKGSL